jgi:hypothetical protein
MPEDGVGAASEVLAVKWAVVAVIGLLLRAWDA